ncbi:Low-affinity cationic amino acid transporter, putative [Pediculus humanus corporis]|uniref:Low-affinity cationic amino acid transporter, putative n=1 Tax=Pediculus humanus subsp. corporis TaxID=121224 RepID=E0VFX9_PEDHC|nr:Low-affinity cationic amino acid transporter, putative [Pediculus humanus corporis]EEB12285.1 Low-affinity cationic amino acid transporter, putative [Pediculus humanus corporis]
MTTFLFSNFYKKLFQTKNLDNNNLTETKLARVLTSLDLTLLGVGSTLGVGIYVLTGEVAKESAGPAVIISFLIAAIASAFAGFCYGEFGARNPKSGSAYAYCYCTVGEFIAFLIGWNLILEYVIGTASVTKALSTYLDELLGNVISDFFKTHFPMNSDFLGDYPDFLAFGIVVLLSICLAFGLKSSTIINNILTILNLCVVAFVIVSGAINANVENWFLPKDKVPPGAGEGGFAPFGFTGILKGAATCFYGFIGFDCIATTGEEAKTPRRSIPIAIVSSLFIVFLTYFGVSTVLTLMWPYYDQNVNAPLSSIFDAIGWIAAKWIVSIGALFGLLPSLLGSLLPLPRIIYAMSSDGLMYEILGRVNEKYKSPMIGTIFSGFLTGIMAMIFNLSQLIDMMSIGTLLAYTIVAACVILLRYRGNEEEKINSLNDSKNNNNKNISMTSKMFKHFFQFRKFTTPTSFSSSLVSFCVFLFCFIILGALSFIVFLPDEMGNATPWAITIFTILTTGAVVLLVIISLQPKSKQKLYFQVPLIPLIPAISITFNLYLMLMLDPVTWIRFGIWILLGIIIYFTYGIQNSILTKSKEVGVEKKDKTETHIDKIFNQ